VTAEHPVTRALNGAAVDAAGVLPVQFFMPRSHDSGVHRLCRAVLADALLLAWGRGTVGRGPDRATARSEARAWLASDDVSWPFAFRAVCDHLGIDAQHLRGVYLERVPASDAGLYRVSERGRSRRIRGLSRAGVATGGRR